jgi:hypothetical protein
MLILLQSFLLVTIFLLSPSLLLGLTFMFNKVILVGYWGGWV